MEGRLPLGRYLMYLRKSRADIERERVGRYETLGKHERELGDMCRRMAIPVEQPPLRELVSGESIAARPQFQALMAQVSTGDVAGVVVHAVDRLGRGDMMQYGYILSTFQFTRTLIVTPGKVYDPADPMDMQQLQLQMFFANTEITGIKRRMRDGKDQAVRDGQYIAARAPMGYRKVRDGRGRKTLEPDEWAPLALRMFEWAADPAVTVYEICRRMAACGAPGRWDPKRVKSAVRNPAYKGMVSWNARVTVATGRDGMELTKSKRKGESPILAPGLHEAIVGDELWDAANRRIGAEPHVKAGQKLRNPLAGLLRCSECGRCMVMVSYERRGKPYAYYQHRRFCDCGAGARPAPAVLVVGMVADALENAAQDCEISAAAGEDPMKAVEAERRAVADAVSKSEAKVDRLVELYVSGGMEAPEYVERRAALDESIKQMRGRLDELNAEVPEPPEQRAVRLKDAMLALSDESIDAAERNALLKSLVDRIEYANDAQGEKPEVKLEIFLK